MSIQQYTPYNDVNQVLEILHENAKAVLKEQFFGMYLYGSLATGDFNPKSSDIDFLVVTEGILLDGTISKLESMHKQIWASDLKWAAKLEGAYIPKDLIRRHSPNGYPCPTVNEGRFYLDRQGSDWIIQRHVIREYGVVLEGSNPKTLIGFVTPEEIQQSVRGVLKEWWFPMPEDPTWLSQHGGEYHAFAVLTMCRALHAIQHGTIVSKPVAANWAKAEFRNWSPLIEKALISQHSPKSRFLDETLEFIRFTRRLVSEELT